MAAYSEPDGRESSFIYLMDARAKPNLSQSYEFLEDIQWTGTFLNDSAGGETRLFPLSFSSRILTIFIHIFDIRTYITPPNFEAEIVNTVDELEINNAFPRF